MTNEERLSCLESELAASKRRTILLFALAGMALLCCTVNVMLLTRQSHREIRAEKITLVDGEGNARAALETVQGTWPRLLFFDRNDSVRVMLSGDPDGSRLVLTKEKTGTISLVATGQGPKILLFYAGDVVRALLNTEKPGTNHTLSYEYGKMRTVIGASGAFTVNNMLVPYPTSSIRLLSPDGKLL